MSTDQTEEDGSNGLGRVAGGFRARRPLFLVTEVSGGKRSYGMRDGELLHGDLTASILASFYEAYNWLKPGYREYLHLRALERELRARGHRVARELAVRVRYKGELLGYQRLDMVVDGLVIIEAKATPFLDKNATRQLYNYLHATDLEVGLLLHFGPKPAFRRIVYENRLKAHAERLVRLGGSAAREE